MSIKGKRHFNFKSCIILSQIGGVELSQIKGLWQDRHFSFIHEAKQPNVDPAFFMQAMYSCALGTDITYLLCFYGQVLGSNVFFLVTRFSTS